LVDLEKAKVVASVDRAEVAEMRAVAAEKRMRAAEEEFEHYRTQQRKTPESALLQELATMKGRLADSDNRVNKERAERNQALLEKEQFRAHIHRLARALKREREKTAATARRDLEQLRLEYVAREERFVLDGDRSELQRIKSELKVLNEQDMALNFEPPKEMGAATRRGSDYEDVDAGVVVSKAREKARSASPLRVKTGGDDTPYSPESYSPQRRAPTSVQTPPEKAIGKINIPIVDGGGMKKMSSAEATAEVARLETERSELLSTGVFDESHPIITQLDRLLNIAVHEAGGVQ
jgi:hypothetical protein